MRLRTKETHHDVIMRSMDEENNSFSKKRNTKKLPKTNDLFISLVSLSYIAAPVEILA